MKNLEEKVETLTIKNKDLTQQIIKAHAEASKRMTMFLSQCSKVSSQNVFSLILTPSPLAPIVVSPVMTLAYVLVVLLSLYLNGFFANLSLH